MSFTDVDMSEFGAGGLRQRVKIIYLKWNDALHRCLTFVVNKFNVVV